MILGLCAQFYVYHEFYVYLTDKIPPIQVLYSRLSLLVLSNEGIVLVTTTFGQFENETMCTILRVPRIQRLHTDTILPI